MQHKGVGFDHKDQWEQISQEHFQVELFGGAIGVMYNKRGLLDVGLPNFRVKKNKQPSVWFDRKLKKVLAIKQAHFDYVWECSCYKTRPKLEKFLKEIEYLHLSDELQQQQLRKAAQNLFFYAQAQHSEKNMHKNGIESLLDFSDCKDLQKILAHPAFEPYKETWTRQLQAFGEAENPKIDLLIESFSQLVQSWKR